MLDKMESLIRSVPLEAYEEIAGTTRQFRRHSRRDFVRKEPDNSTDLTVIEPGTSGDSAEDLMSSLILFQALQGRGSSSSNYYDLDHESAMKLLLMEYRKQLIEAVEFMRSRNETVPPKIEEAIRLIDEQSGWQHWVGRAR